MADRTYLERPSLRRRTEFLTLVRRSRLFHREWVTPPSTEGGFEAYLRNSRKRSSRSFFVCLTENDALAGVVNISQIVGGEFRSAYLGFYAFQSTSRKGYMTDALHLVLDIAFDQMKLHRLEANIQPSNSVSIRLVRALGFELEGYSPKYLKIGGRWRDHERWAILVENWRRRRRRLA